MLAFAMLDYTVRREWFGRTLYVLIVGYVALNVPIVRVLSSPLTLPMIRAAGAPLADSVKYYLTLKNLGSIALILAAGIFLPIGLARWKPQRRGIVIAVIVVSLSFALAGPYAISKVDTAGRYRNAFGALWPTRLRPLKDHPENTDWRSSPFPVSSNAVNQLSQYRGAAAGRNVVLIALESTSARYTYLGMPAIIEKRGFEVLEDAAAIGGNIHSSFGVDDSSTVKRLLSWIDSLKQGERFFVTYLPVAGHHPYATPERGPFTASGDNPALNRSLNALHYGDSALGELLSGLRARNLERNTLFVLFGDHGEAFGQHEGNFGHTLFIYDENIHVPYIIAAPGLIEDKIRLSNAASLIDTAPTILDLLGLPVPENLQGTSLLDPNPRMSLFFTDYSLGWLGLYDACRKYLFEINSDIDDPHKIIFGRPGIGNDAVDLPENQ